MKIRELIQSVNETVSATTTANIAAVPNPNISPGTARGRTSYTGSPGKSGTKAPPQPKAKQPKKSDGTAKGAHEIDSVSLFGGPAIKR